MAARRSLGARTVLYPTPVLVVGTYDADDHPNIMTVAWGGICCSKPPCIAISVRSSRQTYANLQHHRAFTVNLPAADQVAEADYAGGVSGSKIDKFAATGLTAVPAEHVHAPLVGEFPLALECRVIQVLDLGAHTMFVGEILDVSGLEAALADDGAIDVERVGVVTYIPGKEAYYGLGPQLGRAFSMGKKFNAE